MSGDGTVEEESTFTGSIMKYNPTTGLLKTKFADPGLFTRVWWGQDVPWSDLKNSWWSAKDALGDPKIQTYIPNLNFPKASTLALLGQPFPKPSTSDFDSLVVLWKGRFEIVNEGLYNITLNASTAGALLNISGETVIINDDGGAETLTSFKLSAGFHPIQVLWKAPPVDAEYPKAYITLRYSGPDTDGNSAVLSGVHFPFEMDKSMKKDASKMVKPGFGLIEYRLKDPYVAFDDTASGLPSLDDLLNASLLTPAVGARLKKLDLATHEEFVAKLKDKKFPRDKVILLAKGIIKIEDAGDYNFTLESDDGAQLYVDNEAVADTRLDELGELPSNNSDTGTVYLQHGWHLARVVWFENYTNASDPRVFPTGDAARDATNPTRPRGPQVLRLLYSGPDTGGDPSVIRGYYLKGVPAAGSLRGIKLSDGAEEDDGDDKIRERNWAAHFDQDWLSENKDKPWKKLDDADHKIEIDDPVEKIVSPYVDYDQGASDHEHTVVPEEVYDHPAPYDHDVVDIGGKGIKWNHAEADGSYLNTVIGKSVDWSDNWDATPKSVSDLTGR